MDAIIVVPIQRLEELQSGAMVMVLFVRMTCDFSCGVDELAGRSNSVFSIALCDK
jgi:hypothetical protein